MSFGPAKPLFFNLLFTKYINGSSTKASKNIGDNIERFGRDFSVNFSEDLLKSFANVKKTIRLPKICQLNFIWYWERKQEKYETTKLQKFEKTQGYKANQF